MLRRDGVTLIMVKEDPVIANESEFVRFEKELAGDNLFSRSAFEAKIG